MKTRYAWLLGVCFFVSGAGSLALQVAWSKELSYILGNTLYAVATTVAAFMGGLGLGSFLAGRFAERVARPIRAYAFMEFLIAFCAMVSIPVFRMTEPVFRVLYQSFEPGHGAFLLLRFAVVFVLMLIPATFMGMTLPVVVGAYARRRERYGVEAGMLYGVNTLGAVLGTWVAGFFLLETLGLWKTCVFIGALDAAVAGVALWLNKRVGEITDIRKEGKTASQRPASEVLEKAGWGWKQWTVAGVFGASGAVAMVYEVAWFRLLGLTMGPSVYAFSAMLGVYLLGIGLGSTLAAKWAERTKWGGVGAMAVIEGLIGFVGLAGLFYYNGLPKMNYEMFAGATAWFGERGFYVGHIGTAALVVLLPCLGMGALFPVVVRAMREAGGGMAPEANIGGLYVMNTAGGIVGSLGAGFYLLPGLGVWKVLMGASLASVALCVALWTMTTEGEKKRFAYAGASTLGAGLLAWGAPTWNLPLFNQGLYRDVYTASRYDARRVDQQKLVYHREGINAPVAVFNTQGEASLRVTGKADASTISVDLYNQLFAGQIPILFSPDPRRVAIIGYGSGMSVGAILTHKEVESLDVMEIEQAVIGASPYFECINNNPFDDPRTHLILEDGRIHMTYTDKTYDVIVSEPSNPWMAGVSNLFTVDFLRTVRERLTPEGIFCQWIQMYELSEETFKVILASTNDVFPHLAVFRSGTGDVLVIASGKPIQIPWDTFRSRFAQESVRASFERADMLHPLDLFFYFHGPEKQIKEFLASASARNTDDNVWLEHQMPRNMIQMKSTYGDYEKSIGNTVLRLGSEHRLRAYQEMLPGVSVEDCIRQSLAYQFAMEPQFGGAGIMDLWLQVRKVLTQGMRAELRAMGKEDLIEPLDVWTSEGEAYQRNRAAAVQLLASAPRGRLEKETVQKALDLAPDLTVVQTLMGNAFYGEGKYDEAEASFRRALAHPFSNAYYDALIGLGGIAQRRGKPDEAIQLYEQAAARNPYHYVAFRNIALTYRQKQQNDKAREALERGLRYNPGEPNLVREIGNLS